MLACADASPSCGSPDGSAAPFSALDGRPGSLCNEHQQSSPLKMESKRSRALGDAARSVGTAGGEPPYLTASTRPRAESPSASPSRHPMTPGHDDELQWLAQDHEGTRAGRGGVTVL